MKNYKHGLNELVKLGPIIQDRALERPWNSMKLHYRMFLKSPMIFIIAITRRFYQKNRFEITKFFA